MAVTLSRLVAELNNILKPGEFRDYCPNGLQVEGRPEVTKLITGVTASQALLEAALEHEADAILVHHGYFWRGEDESVTGIKKKRLKLLLENDISLIAYHLPLDAHPEFGNNAQLGKLLGFEVEEDLDPKHRSKVGVWGRPAIPLSGEKLKNLVRDRLNREPLHIPGQAQTIERIGWCTGSAQDYIELAHRCGVDAYLTGEVSEQTVHFARETGMHFFAAGHHATERYGVQALGTEIAARLGLAHEFIDIDNPV